MRRLPPSLTRCVINNAVAVPLAAAPYFVLDAWYVWGDKRTQEVLMGQAPVYICLFISFTVLFTANWWASSDLANIGRAIFSIVMSLLLMAVFSLPMLPLLYMFHFAVGGTE